MIICLQTRHGEIHYVSWNSPTRGCYFAMCGKNFFKKNYLNIFSIDESIPGACINCRKIVEQDFKSKSHRSVLGEDIIFEYFNIQAGLETPQQIFEDLLDRRLWTKLRRMKNKMRQLLPKKPDNYKRLYDSSRQFKHK